MNQNYKITQDHSIRKENKRENRKMVVYKFKLLNFRYWEGLVHLFRGTVGTGILALPAAFNQAGYIGGILGIVGVTFMVNYCSLLLVSKKETSVQ